MWGMGWLGRWGQAAYGLGDAAVHAMGAVYDLATLSSANDDYTKMIAGIGNFMGGVKGITGPAGNAISWTMQHDRELYSNYVSRPLSTLETVGSLSDSDIWRRQSGDSEFGTLIDPNAWKQAWAIAKNRSPGQALILMGTHDIMDPREVQDYQRGFWFNLLSGSTDAAISMEYDPLGKAGQAVKATGVLRATKSLPSKLSNMGETPQVSRVEVPSNTRALPPSGPKPDFEFANPRTPPPEDTSLPPTPALEQGGPTPNWRFGQRPGPKNIIPGEVIPSYSDQLGNYISGEKSPIRKTLEWADSKVAKLKDPALAAKAIEKHPMLQNSPKGGLIATLLANSNWGEKELIMKIALGDPEAYYQLVGRREELGQVAEGKREDLAKLLQQAEDMRPDLIKSEMPTDASPGIPDAMAKALNQERIQSLQAEIDALESRESWINDLIGRADRPTDSGIRSALVTSVPKAGAYSALSRTAADARYAIDRAAQRGGLSEQWHYYNTYNTPVRILSTVASRATGAASHLFVDKQPGAYLDVNDPEGWRNLDFMLRRVKGFSADRRNQIVGQYMGATSEGVKLQIANQAEAEAIQHIAARNGLSPDEIDPIINQFMSQRQAARAMLRNRVYSEATDQNGRRIDFVDEENVPTSILPVLKTQLADKLPLANMDTIQTAVARHKWAIRAVTRLTNPRTYNQEDALNPLLMKAYRAQDVATNAADVLSSWWKAGALMRLGYTIKMLTDDELAYLAKLGATGQLHNAVMGATNVGKALGRVATANVRAFKSGDLKNEYAQLGTKPRLGEADVNIPLSGGRSVTAQGMYGGPQDQRDFWRGLSSEGRDLLMNSEDDLLQRMRRDMAQDHFQPGDQGHLEAWTRALNLQLGQDPMARQLLEGSSQQDVVRWLKTSAAGRAYARDLPFRAAAPERWVDNISRMVDHYAPTPEIRQAALDQAVTKKLLREATKGQPAPEVHGGMLRYNMGQGPAAETMNNWRNAFFRHFSQIPTDALVRHPLAQSLYQNRLKDLVQRWDAAGGTVDNETLRTFENQARLHSIKETKKVIFDLTQHSNAAHVFRFIAPFYAPWEETLKRWGRLAYGNPRILFLGNDMWQSFGKMSGAKLEDQDGNPIKGLSGLNADNQLITLRMPQKLAEAIGGQSTVQIPKSSLNITLQGDPWWLPGFGPFVQIPVSELVKDKPNWYQHLKFLLPYGPQSISDTLLPNTAKRFTKWNNEDDVSYSTNKINIWRTRYTQWIQNGQRGPAPRPDDPSIVKDAQRLLGIQWAASMLLPFNPRLSTPYKMYIDKYHQLLSSKQDSAQWDQNAANYQAYQKYKQANPNSTAFIPREAFGPQSARDAFITQYPDFFLFADSISKNNAGVPATVDALQASKKYGKLVGEHPELASVILGDAGQSGGKFDPAVYQYQFGQKLGDTGMHYRDPQSVEAFASQALAEEGWTQYDQIMNILRAELGTRGLKSFSQRGAEDLNRAKTALLSRLGEQNPDWFQAFQGYSAPAKIAQTINGLQQIATDPAMRSRSDITTLNQYLAGREVFERVLAARKAAGGAGSLSAQSNYDLLQKWIAWRDAVAESDTIFQQNIFDRYLSGDVQLQAGGV